jgi:3'(2'), 5'-bisphosphate nucleotidase
MCAENLTESSIDLNRLTLEFLQKVREIAEQQDDFGIQIKSDQSPLTQADLASHEIITILLKKLTPEIPILSEEGEKLEGGVNTFWCVDPLDGTKEFIKRNDEFTVNIALIEHHQPILGVIHIPVMHETFMALKDKGAFKVQNNQQQQLLKYSANVNQPPIFAVSRSHLNEQTKDFIQQHQANIIVAGSSLKLTLLAEDKADAYPRFGPTSLWDMAAGHAILKQTGGEIYTLDRQPLVYNVKHILNPDLIAVRHKDIIFNMRVTHES